MGKERKKTFHHHGCKKCRTKFGDNCPTPNEEAICRHCAVGAQRWVLLWEAALPKDCCIETAKRIDLKSKEGKAIAKSYDLSLACPWYQCQLCKRNHPYDDPTKVRREGWGGPTRL